MDATEKTPSHTAQVGNERIIAVSFTKDKVFESNVFHYTRIGRRNGWIDFSRM